MERFGLLSHHQPSSIINSLNHNCKHI